MLKNKRLIERTILFAKSLSFKKIVVNTDDKK